MIYIRVMRKKLVDELIGCAVEELFVESHYGWFDQGHSKVVDD